MSAVFILTIVTISVLSAWRGATAERRGWVARCLNILTALTINYIYDTVVCQAYVVVTPYKSTSYPPPPPPTYIIAFLGAYMPRKSSLSHQGYIFDLLTKIRYNSIVDAIYCRAVFSLFLHSNIRSSAISCDIYNYIYKGDPSVT